MMEQVAYTTLKVAKFDNSVTDREIYLDIFEKCHGFKGFNIKVVTGDHGVRLAYINFVTHEDASKCFKIRRRCLQTMGAMSLSVTPILSKIQREKKERVPSLLSMSKSSSRIGSDRHKGSVGGLKDLRSRLRIGKDAPAVKSPERKKLLQKPFTSGTQTTSKYRNKANKNVYVGNLDPSVTKEEIQEIFEPYGFVEDVDLKMSHGVRMAFVKYFNLDMAIRGLREVRGKRIGGRLAQLGFGSLIQTRCLWIGGIGPWTDEVQLMRTFGEYGDIVRFEWPHEKPFAYVLFDTQTAATNAFENLQGLPLGPDKKKIRLDYSTISSMDSKLNYQEFKFEGMDRDTNYWDGIEKNANGNDREEDDDKPRSLNRRSNLPSSRSDASDLSADRKRRFSGSVRRKEDSGRANKNVENLSTEFENITPPLLSALQQLVQQSQITPSAESNLIDENMDDREKDSCNDLRDVLKKHGPDLRGKIGFGLRGSALTGTGARGRGLNQKRSSGNRPAIGSQGEAVPLLQNRRSNEMQGDQNVNMDFRISDRGSRDGSIPEERNRNVRRQEFGNLDRKSEQQQRRSVEGNVFNSGAMHSDRPGRYSPRDGRAADRISRDNARRSSDRPVRTRMNQNDDGIKMNREAGLRSGRGSNINTGGVSSRGTVYLNKPNVGSSSVRGRMTSRERRKSSERRGGGRSMANSRMSSERNSVENRWNTSDNEDFHMDRALHGNRFDNKGHQDVVQDNYGMQEQEDNYSGNGNDANRFYSNRNNNSGQYNDLSPRLCNSNDEAFRNNQEFSLRQSNRSSDFESGHRGSDSRTNISRPLSRDYHGSRDGRKIQRGGSNRRESGERPRSRGRDNNLRASRERHGSRHRHGNRSSGEHQRRSRDGRRHRHSSERDSGNNRVRSRDHQTNEDMTHRIQNQRGSRERFGVGNRHGGNRDSTDRRASRKSKSWDDDFSGAKRNRSSRSPQRDDHSKRRRLSGNPSRELGPRTPSPNELMDRNQSELTNNSNRASSFDDGQAQAGNINLSHLNPLYPEDEMQASHGRMPNQVSRFNPTVAPPAFTVPMSIYPDNMFSQPPPPLNQPRMNFGGGMPPMSIGRFPMTAPYGNNAGVLVPPPPVRIPAVVSMLGVNNEISRRFPAVWSGAMVLKNSAFVSSMYLVSGSVPLVDALLRDPSSPDCPVLKISQRLRLDEPQKLHELERRIASSGRNGCSVLLAAPAAAQVGDVNNVIQQRALLSLGVYLREKQCAAVIFLPPGCRDGEETGVMHAFPPCHFASEFLRKEAEELTPDYPKDDHLLIIVMRDNPRS